MISSRDLPANLRGSMGSGAVSEGLAEALGLAGLAPLAFARNSLARAFVSVGAMLTSLMILSAIWFSYTASVAGLCGELKKGNLIATGSFTVVAVLSHRLFLFYLLLLMNPLEMTKRRFGSPLLECHGRLVDSRAAYDAICALTTFRTLRLKYIRFNKILKHGVAFLASEVEHNELAQGLLILVFFVS